MPWVINAPHPVLHNRINVNSWEINRFQARQVGLHCIQSWFLYRFIEIIHMRYVEKKIGESDVYCHGCQLKGRRRHKTDKYIILAGRTEYSDMWHLRTTDVILMMCYVNQLWTTCHEFISIRPQKIYTGMRTMLKQWALVIMIHYINVQQCGLMIHWWYGDLGFAWG